MFISGIYNQDVLNTDHNFFFICFEKSKDTFGSPTKFCCKQLGISRVKEQSNWWLLPNLVQFENYIYIVETQLT